MRIVGTIQARMGSSRLPGKVMKDVCGKPLLAWQLGRLQRSRLMDEVVVATTTNPLDNCIADYCAEHNIPCFRGSEDDVLGRIANTLRTYDVDIHVEFFGDSPLVDPHIIDEVIGMYLKVKDQYDCVCNSLKTTYPPGQEVLVHRGDVLQIADETIPHMDPMREHVSVHLTKNPDVRVLNLEAPDNYYYPNMYLEVDTENDFSLITEIVSHFNKLGKKYFSLSQIIDFMQSRPELIKLNQEEERRWKEFRDDA